MDKNERIDLRRYEFERILNCFEECYTILNNLADANNITWESEKHKKEIDGARNILANHKESKEIEDIYVWDDSMSLEQCIKGAYWERNMIAQLLGFLMNKHVSGSISGWYNENDKRYGNWNRIISLLSGSICFHVPDSFKISKNFPEIKNNWDGHTTAEKWKNIINFMEGVED